MSKITSKEWINSLRTRPMYGLSALEANEILDSHEALRSELAEAVGLLHQWTDNYQPDDDCVCDRCVAYPRARAFLARTAEPDALIDKPGEG